MKKGTQSMKIDFENMTCNTLMNKHTLRHDLKKKRMDYVEQYGSHAYDFSQSFKAWSDAENIDFTHSCVALYMPMNYEASPQGILNDLIKNHIAIALPVMIKDVMHFVQYDAHTPLTLNNFGFWEPRADACLFTVPHILIIPLLGIDDQGYRIGYGKGHYDRYIHTHHDHITFKMGLALPCQKIPTVPHEPHDKKLDGVLFPNTYTLFS